MKKMKMAIGIGLIAAIVVGGTFGYNNFNKKSDASVPMTVTVESETLKQVINTDGVVKVKSEGEIFASSGGMILNRYVEYGDPVKAGQVLFQLDTTDLKEKLAQAEYQLLVDQDSYNDLKMNGNGSNTASYDRAKAAYDRALKDYESNKSLYQNGAISSSELEQYKSKVEVSYTDLIAAQDRLQSNQTNSELRKLADKIKLDQLSIKNIRDDIQASTITATQDGVLVQVIDEANAYINPGTLIATIADLGSLEVEAMISEYDIPKIKIGQTVEIVSLGNEKKIYKGQVEAIDSIGVTQNDEVLVKTTISLLDADTLIKPNFTVSLEIVVTEKRNAMAVPYEAVVKKTNGEYAVTKIEGEAQKEVIVEKGLETDLMIELISGDIKVGDTILIPKDNATAKEKESTPGPSSEAQNL